MLEKMSAFFEARLEGYDQHMLNNIESAREFYPFTASLLPCSENSRVLDLGCGTGLELEEYFLLCPTAKVTGIDLSEKMLSTLERKFTDKDITLVLGSYFDLPLGEDSFDAAVSVESLHHFTKKEKVPLYSKLYSALKDNGYFILTDYFALSDEEERLHRQTLNSLKSEQGICDNELYHYDTPLTIKHETEALLEAGFSTVEVLNHWGATFTLKAVK
ncbi:MAG: class I SAM-dependent methyltransferase [Ruminococcaceae bacterium]|nr:class I SAM-dependent methyltransferase [Oscillospiraceae bacterium]